MNKIIPHIIYVNVKTITMETTIVTVHCDTFSGGQIFTDNNDDKSDKLLFFFTQIRIMIHGKIRRVNEIFSESQYYFT